MAIITSVNNERIKKIRKLKQVKYMDINKEFIIETKHLIDEALLNNNINLIITTDINYINKDVEVLYASDNVMNSLSSLHTPSKYLGICHYLDNKIDYNKDIIVLDNIQDSGNLGTILRNCLAFNYHNIIISNNSVSIYNSKIIQASQGAIFNLNVIYTDILAQIAILKENNYQLIGTALENSISIKEYKHNNLKKAIFFGNEGKGLNKDILKLMDYNIKIDINDINSLNVACANAIILYEFSIYK